MNMKNRLFRRIAVMALCVLLLATLVSCGSGSPYLKWNLKKYVKLSQEDYLGVNVTLTDTYEITDEDVEEAILALRFEERTLLRSGVRTAPIELGDDVYIYYWGTYLKNGQEIQFSGGSNMTDYGDPYQLTIGSGQFVDGFEDGLLNVFPNQTGRKYNTETGLTVAADSVVYLTIENYQYDDGNNNISGGTYDGLRVDLSDPGILGSAFAEKLTGLTVGATFDFGYKSDWENSRLPIDWDGDGETELLALTGKIDAIGSSEKWVDVKATFPDNYGTPSLAGVEATFHVMITAVDEYEVPALSEEMIAESYPAFTTEEPDVPAAFSAYIRELLEEDAAEQRTSDIEDAIWDYMAEKAEFTGSYPKKGLSASYDDAYAEMVSEYQYYSSYMSQQYNYTFSGIDEFASAYYDLDEGETWKDYLNQVAEDMTKEKLIIYSIVRQEGWQLTDEEFESGSQEVLLSYANEYGITPSAVLSRLGEDVIAETVLYNKVMAKLVEAAVVTGPGES